MQKTALVIMAAGIGSRFGEGIKQLAPVGPCGEIIMDYSIHDALEAGFNKVVFIIRKDLEEEFRRVIGERIEKITEVEYVFQELDDLPEGFTKPADRTKPWGTGQAVLAAKKVLDEPFIVINADDFYGRDSFAVLGKALSEMDGKKNDYCMVGYRVGNTLSESGSVARGICGTNEGGYLTTVVERTEIMRVNGPVCYKDEKGEWVAIEDNTPVSMNMWGFTPDYFKYSEDYFVEFLKENRENLKAEYYIPLMVNKLINDGTARVKVLDTTAKWFGVTYAADRQSVVDKIQALVDAGEYPAKLF